MKPEEYDEEYFLGEDYGGIEFYNSGVKKPCPSSDRIFSLIKRANEGTALDAGCGKGEMLYFLSKKGFDVYGIDYSQDAIALAKKTLKEKKVNAWVGKSDVRKTSFDDNFFDVVVSTDLVEHLDDDDAVVDFLNEMHRVLKPGGVFYMHTAPNKLYVDFFQRLYRRQVDLVLSGLANLFLSPKNKIKIKTEFRDHNDKKFHINEQTYFSMRNNLSRSKFSDYKIEMFADPFRFEIKKLPYYLIGYLFPLNKIFPLSILLGNHIYCVLKKR